MINGARLHRSRRRDGFRNLYESLFDDPRPQVEKIVRWILKNKHTFEYKVRDQYPNTSSYSCTFSINGENVNLLIFDEFSFIVTINECNEPIDMTTRECALIERALSDITKL